MTHLLIEDLDLESGWLHVTNKKELGWRIKTGAERNVPLIGALSRVLRRVIAGRTAGPVFVRRLFLSGERPPLPLNRKGLGDVLSQRVTNEEERRGRELSREERLRVARTVWRDAGALKEDRVRTSFLQGARADGGRCGSHR